MDSGESEYKDNTNNSRATGDVAGTVADTDKDVQSALSNIGQLGPSHPWFNEFNKILAYRIHR